MTGTGLLSRIAETLFWTGRYVERADDTARMVDVYVHRMLEEPQSDEEAGCGALLAVLGMLPPPDARLDIGQTLDQLAYDPASPSAIAGAVLAARSGASLIGSSRRGRSLPSASISARTWVTSSATACRAADGPRLTAVPRAKVRKIPPAVMRSASTSPRAHSR